MRGTSRAAGNELAAGAAACACTACVRNTVATIAVAIAIERLDASFERMQFLEDAA
jgi:hypothetical protein